MPTATVTLPILHTGQNEVKREEKRFNVIVCGRRWGKTFLGQDIACDSAIDGKRVGWFAPNYKYLKEAFKQIRRILKPITKNCNATDYIIELVTGGIVEFWTLEDPDAGRSRKYDVVIIDEAGLCLELAERWREAIRATLMDTGGKAYFLGTPKPPKSIKLSDYAFYQFYQRGIGESEEWKSFHKPSSSNPHLSPAEIEAMRHEPGMTQRIARQEIDAEFLTQSTDALWNMGMIDPYRVQSTPDLKMKVVAVDPGVTANENSDASGIIYVARGVNDHYYVITDSTGIRTPGKTASVAVNLANHHEAKLVYESNQGGDYIELAFQQVDQNIRPVGIPSVGDKAFRADPVVALYEMGLVHHVGEFPELEDELVNWNPYDKKMPSPNRLDALVIGIRYLSGHRPTSSATWKSKPRVYA